MFIQPELAKKSKTELKNWIEAEKSRAVYELSQIEDSLHGLFANGQALAAHPLSTIRDLAKPTRDAGAFVSLHPIGSVTLSLVSGLCAGLILNRTRRTDTSTIKNSTSKLAGLKGLVWSAFVTEFAYLAQRVARGVLTPNNKPSTNPINLGPSKD